MHKDIFYHRSVSCEELELPEEKVEIDQEELDNPMGFSILAHGYYITITITLCIPKFKNFLNFHSSFVARSWLFAPERTSWLIPMTRRLIPSFHWNTHSYTLHCTDYMECIYHIKSTGETGIPTSLFFNNNGTVWAIIQDFTESDRSKGCHKSRCGNHWHRWSLNFALTLSI